MFNWLFKKKYTTQIGIDLGNSAIKVVELSKQEGRLQLVNYALAQSNEEILGLSDLKSEEIAAVLKSLLLAAKIGTRRASISLPVERTFSTVIDMPMMKQEEMAAAIPYEAQKYVPVPIDEVVLDWSVIPESSLSKPADATEGDVKAETEAGAKKTTISILIVAVPKDIIDKIIQIAKLAGLEISALEQEAFSLTRSLIGNDNGAYLIADFGSKCTDLIVVEQGLVRLSHSLETVNKESILMEMDRIVNLYQMRYNKKVGQCLMTGGGAADKEKIDFLAGKLKLPIKLGNPLARVSHQPILDRAIDDLSLQLSVAVGLAMRE